MKKLTLQDVRPLSEYESLRPEFRRRIIAMKKDRRVSVGPLITLVFENRDTLLYQIQEMMRIEHLYDPHQIQGEIDAYNPLVPEKDELSATLFIEITEENQIRETLDRLQGIDDGRSVYLELDAERIYGRFEEGHSKEDKLSAVHYVWFRLGPEQRKRLTEAAMAVLVVDHPNYKAAAPLSASLRKTLSEELGHE
jgi:hypothetical protein